MPRIALAVTDLPGTRDPAYVSATVTLSDEASDHIFPLMKGDMVVVFNTGVGAHTVILVAAANQQGRVGPSSSQSVAGGAMGVFGPLRRDGWVQPAPDFGDCKVNSDDNPQELVFAVLRGAAKG